LRLSAAAAPWVLLSIHLQVVVKVLLNELEMEWHTSSAAAESLNRKAFIC
jgi:hypothetical protein